MKKEKIKLLFIEQEAGTLYLYGNDGRMFAYLSDDYTDKDDYQLGKEYTISYKSVCGINVIEDIQ